MKRVLLKLSGEALQGPSQPGVSIDASSHVAKSLKTLLCHDHQIGIVVGGGNFFRGKLAKDFQLKRTPADQIGMLATVMNGLFLSAALQTEAIDCVVMGTHSYGGVVEAFHQEKAQGYLKDGKVVIFVGGTGNPYFTTDSAAALRACQIDADILLKATKVDGVYDKDPKQFKDAKKYDQLTYSQALAEGLEVMDGAAIALVRQESIPIFVFDFFKPDALIKAVLTQQNGTTIS